MKETNNLLTSYKKITRLYDQIWIIIIAIAVGLVIMQLISGNLKSKNLSGEELTGQFPCTQTSPNEVTELNHDLLKTNFDISLIETKRDLLQTNLYKNDVPAVTQPQFSDLSELEPCLNDSDELVVVTLNTITKLYPKKILQQHLLVNDSFGDDPVLISYCALCDSVNVYSRVIEDQTLEFANTGILYKNNDILFDSKTESLWAQLTGEALVGDYTGSVLERLPAKIITYGQAKKTFNEKEILNFDTGFIRNYNDASSLDFESNNKIVGPIINTDDSLPLKRLILGFKIANIPYAVDVGKISNSNNYTANGSDIVITKDENGIELKVNGAAVIYTFSYWYVWHDFFPETTLL